MKRALVLLLLLLATTAFADERTEKRQLISELLEVIDAKVLMQASLEALIGAASEMTTMEGEDIPAELRAQWEESQRRQQEQMRNFRERMYTHIDYAKYFDEVYVPMFEKNFTADELRHLIVFFKTKHGQKVAKMLPEFGVARSAGMKILSEAAAATQEELEKEDAAKHPWKKTMSDMRMIATALEAHFTDTGDYPKVEFEALEAVLAPTYIKVVPKVDSWGTPFLYVSDGKHYRFVSAGADKRFEWSARQLVVTAEKTQSESLDADLIFQDGDFLQFPKAANVQ